MTKLRLHWESWRSSLWFLPTVLVLGAVVLAQGLIEIDRHIDRTNLQSQWPRLFGAGAAGSRGMLTAIASSMITVAGVAFSITIVALALASSQYTSRILRNSSTFPGMLAEAFDQIRKNAAGNVTVLLCLLQALEVIAVRTQDAHRRQALLRHADLIAEVAYRTIPAPRDRDGIEAALERLAQITKKETSP